jgi:anti-anti-sigma regulatory factor
MPPKFKYAVHRRDEITYLKLSGVIDEDNELPAVADQVAPGTLVVDLSEIDRINSCGVRDWVNWLGRVEKIGARVVMSECSPAIVAQINLVNNFTAAGVVKSFYAPYFCPQCDHEKVLLIETRDAVGQRPFRAPSCRCDECDGPMDFDDMEDSYFAFLANTSKIVTDSRVDDVVAEFTPSDGSHKLRTKSSLSGPKLTPGQSGGATLTGSLSMPSVSTSSGQGMMALGRQVSGNHQGVTTGRHILPPPPEELSRRIELAKANPRSNYMAWMIAGALFVAAMGLVAYLFLAQPEAGGRSAPPPPPPTAPR